MKHISHLLMLAVSCAALANMSSCITANQNDEPEVVIPGGQDVWLAQDHVDFDMYGGTASIEIKSKVVLLFQNPLGTDYPGGTSQNSSFDSYFAANGNRLECEKMIIGDMFYIKANKTEMRQTQYEDINLYDQSGQLRATVHVSQAGNPSLGRELGSGGKAVVKSCYEAMERALSHVAYVERCYTGFLDQDGVKPPLSVNNLNNSTAYLWSTNAIKDQNGFITTLTNGGVAEETPYYTLLKSIVYTEMADKWGNVAILEHINDSVPAKQITQAELLQYVRSGLDSIASGMDDVKSWGYTTDPVKLYKPSKDVWRMAMANVEMQLGEYENAAKLLQQIVDSDRYALVSDANTAQSSETIWMMDLVDYPGYDKLLEYYTYPDVLLSLAECKVKLGDGQGAKELVSQLASVKELELTGQSIIDDIDMLRQVLWLPRYFAFQKRNALGGYEAYQHLWPIPTYELGTLTQNPGY